VSEVLLVMLYESLEEKNLGNATLIPRFFAQGE